MKNIISIIILFLLIGNAFAQEPIVAWEKRFPSSIGTTLIADSSGGFVVCSSSPQAVYVTLMSASGDTIWHHGIDTLVYALDMKRTLDGGFILSGGDGWNNMYLVKLNSTGEEVWTKGFLLEGFIIPEYLSAISQVQDGGYLCIATSMLDESSTTIIRSSETGDTLWTRRFNISIYDTICAVLPFPDNSFLMVRTANSNFPPQGISLTKCSAQGDSLWTRSYNDVFLAKDAKRFGDYLYIVGTIEGWMTNGFGIMVTDTTGNPIWIHNDGQGNGGCATSVNSAGETHFIVSGVVCPFDLNNTFYLAEFDTWGNRTWNMYTDIELSSPLSSTAFDAIQLADSGFVFLAEEYNEDTHIPTMLLTKLCPEGSDAGSIRVIKNAVESGGYRLHCDNGSVDTLIFPNVSPGTTGWVSGSAADHWSIVSAGESIVFASDQPLTTGSVDTFWISRPNNSCQLEWSAGCRSGAVDIWTGEYDSLRFTGARLDPLTVQLTLHAYGEHNIQFFEIWGCEGLPFDGHFVCIHIAAAIHDSLPHTYTYNDVGGHTQWFVTAVSQGGCRLEFRNLTLYLNSIPVSDPLATTIKTFSLSAYPNPFNPSTNIAFTLPQTSKVRLAVYDIIGREVKVIREGITETGEHYFTFDGASLPSGIYFARLESTGFVKTVKLLLVK